MSTAAVRTVPEEPRAQLQIVARAQERPPAKQEGFAEFLGGVTDRHPLLLVVVAGATALVAASVLIGSIVLWLSVRHYGLLRL